jgi:prophage tail gpP-like protein
MIIVAQIHVKMMLHVLTRKQTTTAIVLKTGREKTVACLDCSAAAHHVKVELTNIVRIGRTLCLNA